MENNAIGGVLIIYATALLEGSQTKLAVTGCVEPCMTLTGLVALEGFVGLVPHGLAVLLQFVEAVLLPGAGADLDQLPTHQQKLEICITFQT